jgi:hypothetical protein
MAMAEANLSYIFRCTTKTETECFDRMLFGEKPKHKDWVKKIRKGDTLFLYNIDSEVLIGHFRAASDGTMNIEPEAWKGDFPYQVKVEKIGEFEFLHKKDLGSLIAFDQVYKKTHPIPVLTLQTTEKLMELFTASDKTKVYIPKERLPEPKIKTLDGHRVRSAWERRLDDWLAERSIFHYYEKQINVKERLYCDFFIPKNPHLDNKEVYIELWGKTDPDYLKNRERKIRIYREYSLNLVEVFPDEMQDLDVYLLPKLKKFQIE